MWLVIVLISHTAFGQSPARLDANNGYGQLTFFKSAAELKKVIPLKRTASSSKTKEEIYVVKHPQDFDVYCYAVASITLYFY